MSESVDKPEPERVPWQSDAEKLNLPRATTTSGTGARRLDVDEVLRRATPNHAKEK